MSIEVEIDNFKSINHTTLKLEQGVNVLVGSNGSGKTCLLTSLKFLRDTFSIGVGRSVAKNGGSLRTFNRGKKSMKFTITYDYGDRIFKRVHCPFKIIYSLKIGQKGKENLPVIVYETFTLNVEKGNTVFKIFELTMNRENLKNITYETYFMPGDLFGKDLFTYWQFDYPSNISKNEIIQKSRSSMEDLLNAIKTDNDTPLITHLISYDRSISQFYDYFVNLNEYNIIPDIARQETDQMPYAEMLPNGKGLAEVIHALSKKYYHKIKTSRAYELEQEIIYRRNPYRFTNRSRYMGTKFNTVLDNINKELSSAVHNIDSIDIETNPTNGKRYVVFCSGKTKFYPEEVSDGTIKWLSILTSLFISFSNSYIIEEPENFLHPWMQQKLISIMREQAENEKRIFLITTHSVSILNTLRPEEIIIARMSDTGTSVKQLEDISEIKSILDSSEFGLGDLWVSGAIGGIPDGAK